MKKYKIKKCNHVVNIKQITDFSLTDGMVYQHWVNGDVCIKCGKLLCKE